MFLPTYILNILITDHRIHNRPTMIVPMIFSVYGPWWTMDPSYSKNPVLLLSFLKIFMGVLKKRDERSSSSEMV